PDTPIASKRSKRDHSSTNTRAAAPLSERLRPTSLDDFVGHLHLTGPDGTLSNLVKLGTGSIVLWGPPGCGKTTLARLLANSTDAVFKELSATSSGVNDIRPIVEEAKNVFSLTRRRTIMFLDEIHRFTKAQQDVFLPFVESGQIQLIGATTENPSFKLTNALLSRCRVLKLERLTDEEITRIVVKAVKLTSLVLTTPPFPSHPQLTPRILASLTSLSAGDARTALSLLELVLVSAPTTPEATLLASLRNSVSTSYDRTGDAHYDLISALHKSVRGSQPDAALYWLARMLGAGEDPLYIARRMTVCASEDIGLADNHALVLATATTQACQQVGMPECRINLAHLVSYLAEAPKSTRAYEAYARAEAAAKQDMTVPVPIPMRNAPTGLMKDMGYGEGYCYNPEYAHPVTNDYIPERFRNVRFLREIGDRTDKTWDEKALRRWEVDENNGKEWEGRVSHKNI
ncbi:hypothetical protein HETIRDRAFT_46394, partial [Heterobasidion irregulare TC 32-1]